MLARARGVVQQTGYQQAPADDGNPWAGMRFSVGFLLVSKQQNTNKHPPAMEILGREFDLGVGFLGACEFLKNVIY